MGEKRKVGRPKKEGVKASPRDRIECEICGTVYTRSNVTAHRMTKFHLLHKNNDIVKRDNPKEDRQKYRSKKILNELEKKVTIVYSGIYELGKNE